ncbi:glycosyl transferase family 1 [Pontibacillus halophilus JSM 076056 = DSM 19796]|uniref:Glycosyl transferase family 1 n=1 Tax=Pontibacillus halophilus JSM 076056 = DSM 19796 TaxID=1385510 RepID=A0A0A5GMN7_9BACI|nr:glycosyltransferase family 4 protein [Pontibacillus halophilus]KGX92430.1 glycosyl transferase family 1 [Pontibacillus halophilus JSM 076056 = DSM 19796]
MKILFVYYVPSGGVETHNRMRQQALKGHTCEFLYYRKQRKLVNDHGAPVHITNDDAIIRNLLSKKHYDVMVVISDYSALQRFRNLGFKGKMILEVQGFGPKDNARSILERAKPIITAHADGLLNPRTPHIQSLYNELYPTVPKFNFNNAINYSRYSYVPTPKHPNPIVAWIGRLEDNKNWREFLRIGEQIVKRAPSTELYMFEDPTLSTKEERNAFEALKKTLGLQNHVKVLQNVPNDDMRTYFSKIGDSGGFLCMTSKVEGAPYAPLEALCAKCPVLTTDNDGVRSSIIHNETGKYYRIGDIQHGVKEAMALMRDQSLRSKIRTQGVTHVQTNFSLERYNSNFTYMLQLISTK